jgi:hypothetical protein
MRSKSIIALIAASVFFILSSCTKEKSYYVTYKGHYSYATINIFEYDKDGNPIHHEGGKFYQGKTREFTAHSSAAMVKIHVELPFDIGWIPVSYALSSESISIIIDDDTRLGAEP